MFPAGMYSIGTDVDNLEEVKAKGIEIVRGPVETTVEVMAFVQDPNGVNICLVEKTA